MITIFYISCIIAVLSTIMVITRLNAIHALLYLVVSLLSVAVVFFTLGAAFAAALEIIIYAGAIMVLFIFVVMMLNLGPATIEQENKWLSTKMWVGPGILSFILLVELVLIFSLQDKKFIIHQVPPKEVGIALYGPYLLGVELSAMLLMAGIIGAFHLGKKKQEVMHRFFMNKNKEEITERNIKEELK